jgi:large subunit ribosomal protein L4
MPNVDVFNVNAEKVGTLTLSDRVFAAEVKSHTYYEVIKWQLAEKRSGSASTKTRSEVSGSTRKMFRQKGTGRARRGDNKSPLLKRGGVVFGPKPKDWSYTIPKKLKKTALRSALSSRASEKALLVIDRFALEKAKSRTVLDVMKRFNISNALIVDTENDNLSLSCRNLKEFKMLNVDGLNLFDMLKYNALVLTTAAAVKIDGVLA